MPITPLGAPLALSNGAGVSPGTGGSPPQHFRSTLDRAPSPRAAEPHLEGHPLKVVARPVEPAKPGKVELPGIAMVDRLQGAQHRMDEVLRLAESGRNFTPAELLSLQTQVYRASQELDLAGKVVEKATGGVKQVLQTQL